MNSRNLEEVLKGRFAKQVFTEEGDDLKKEIRNKMRSRNFSSPDFFGEIRTIASEESLVYEHLLKHRFVDMKFHKYGKNRVKRKNHQIHNRMLYGKANNLIYRLSYGFTESVKEQLKTVDLNS